MRLIQAKVRCVEGVVDSGWLVPGRQSTVIYGPVGSGKRHFLKALEALNPVYDITFENPFVNHPEVWQQGKYKRRVFPERKTAVLMVFSAQPNLVRELDSIDPALIETDRIEVGRRLDLSRWITFVEISASTRWSEIADQMKTLRERLQHSGKGVELLSQADFIDMLATSDRVKGEVAVTCVNWLNSVADVLTEDDRSLLDVCIQKTQRAERFITARQKVEEWLPPTIAVHKEQSIRAHYPFSLLEKVDTGCDPVVSLMRKIFHSYRLGSKRGRERFCSTLKEPYVDIKSLLVAGIILPELVVNENGFTLTGYTPDSILAKRVQLMGLVALLSTVCYGRPPLLLIDQLDEGMDDETADTFIGWLQDFSGYCQIILATGSRRVALRPGWQAVKRIGPEGLTESGIISE